jgi:peptide deformylase
VFSNTVAPREIIHYPDPRLRLKSSKVTHFDEDLRKLVNDLADTMYFANGIGLAAIQVAVAQRVLVIDIGGMDVDEDFVEGDEESERKLASKRKVKKLEIYINPEILKSSGEIEYEEGCLSVPGVYATVYATVCRKESLRIRYQDLTGKVIEEETHGLKSIVLQHEIDHLDGIVFPDRLSAMNKMMILQKYNKLQKEPVEEES